MPTLTACEYIMRSEGDIEPQLHLMRRMTL